MEVAVLLLGLSGGRANGQIYPDPKMTKLFKNRLEALAKSQTRVFVSDCNLSRVGNEKALLTIPIGSSSGTLLLLSKGGDVYNGSGVTYDAHGVVLVEPGGDKRKARLPGVHEGRQEVARTASGRRAIEDSALIVGVRGR